MITSLGNTYLTTVASKSTIQASCAGVELFKGTTAFCNMCSWFKVLIRMDAHAYPCLESYPDSDHIEDMDFFMIHETWLFVSLHT